MPRHIVRMAKRRTAWESTSTEELIQTEFLDKHGGVDLRPSVYVFDADGAQTKHGLVVRLRAEHAVSLMKSPNAAGPHVDFEGVTPRLQSSRRAPRGFRSPTGRTTRSC